MTHAWIMIFLRTADDQLTFAGPETRGERVYVRTECAEDELVGEKEQRRMQLEDERGGSWTCTIVMPVERI